MPVVKLEWNFDSYPTSSGEVTDVCMWYYINMLFYTIREFDYKN